MNILTNGFQSLNSGGRVSRELLEFEIDNIGDIDVKVLGLESTSGRNFGDLTEQIVDLAKDAVAKAIDNMVKGAIQKVINNNMNNRLKAPQSNNGSIKLNWWQRNDTPGVKDNVIS